MLQVKKSRKGIVLRKGKTKSLYVNHNLFHLKIEGYNKEILCKLQRYFIKVTKVLKLNVQNKLSYI